MDATCGCAHTHTHSRTVFSSIHVFLSTACYLKCFLYSHFNFCSSHVFRCIPVGLDKPLHTNHNQTKIYCPSQHFNVSTQCYIFRFAWPIIRHLFWQHFNKRRCISACNIILLVTSQNICPFIKIINMRHIYRLKYPNYVVNKNKNSHILLGLNGHAGSNKLNALFRREPGNLRCNITYLYRFIILV